MELVEALKKYRYHESVTKMELYKKLEKNKELLLEEGFSFNVKAMQDLFDMEVIIGGIQNKNSMEQCYNHFVSENFDTFEYINYDEKRKMFNHDIELLLPDFCMFKEKGTHIPIYIPYLENFINQRYVEDYQVLTLKKHQEYLKEYPRQYENCRRLYGIYPYLSSFSSLEPIGRDEAYIYLYCIDSKSVFVYNKEGNEINEICIVDKYSAIVPTVEQVKEVIKVFLNTEDDIEVLSYMLEQGFIKEKTFKKISKRLD